jgi:hypothetical protein
MEYSETGFVNAEILGVWTNEVLISDGEKADRNSDIPE